MSFLAGESVGFRADTLGEHFGVVAAVGWLLLSDPNICCHSSLATFSLSTFAVGIGDGATPALLKVCFCTFCSKMQVTEL